MPQIHSQNLPPTHKKHLHQDFLENERDYWEMRDWLMREYQGQEVAFSNYHQTGRRHPDVKLLPRNTCGTIPTDRL